MDGIGQKPKRSVLGRGLSALISSSQIPVQVNSNLASDILSSSVEEVRGSAKFEDLEKRLEGVGAALYIDISKIEPSTLQPRQEFKTEQLQELADSIKSHGVLQPLIVRRKKDAVGVYEIVAGERRWRAAEMAQLRQVPVIVIDLEDNKALEIAIIENVQRADLNPVEEARAYQRLIDEFKLTQLEVSERVGKERTSVANALRLLNLPQEILSLVQSGALSRGHAKALLSLKEQTAQVSLARKVIKDGLSVRELEGLISNVTVLDAGRRARNAEMLKNRGSSNSYLSGALVETLDRLRASLGTKVNIKHNKGGKGKIEIDYFSEQELDRIVEVICGLDNVDVRAITR